jgi:hypothetical protein
MKEATSPIHALLSRLGGVKETGLGRWIACCPAQGDKRPSLSVRETSDGTVLVKCFAGCGAADIAASVGLTLHDLFPKPLAGRGPLRPRERWIPSDVLRCVGHEAVVVCLAAEATARGETLAPQDVDRLVLAATRLRAAAREVGHDI